MTPIHRTVVVLLLCAGSFLAGKPAPDGTPSASRLPPTVPATETADNSAEPTPDFFATGPYPSHGYPWENNSLGITDSVPEPWTDLEIEGRDIRLSGRTYALQESGLPRQMVVADQQLFTKPPELILQIDGSNVAVAGLQSRVVEQKPCLVTMSGESSSPDYTLSFDVTVEFDGLYKGRLTIRTEKEISIERLQLQFSFRKELATYFSRFIAYDFDAMRADRTDLLNSYGRIGEPYSVGFVPTFWVGNDKMGLEWVCETDLPWHTEDDGNRLQLLPDKDRVLFTVNVVDKPLLVNGSYSFEFGLFTTPARPSMAGEERRRLVSAHLDDCFTEDDFRTLSIYGIGWHRQTPKKYAMLPILTPPSYMPQETFDAFIDGYTAKGGRFIPYGALYAFPRILPGKEWEHYRGYWLTRDSLDDPAFSKNKAWARMQELPPGENSLVYVTFIHKSLRDFLVYYYVQAVKTGRVHGMYLDVSSPNILSTVPFQPYGSHVKNGGLYYPFFAQRQLLKRLYIACRAIDPDFLITQHTSKISSVVAGFTGIVAGGESLNIVFRGDSTLKQCQADIDAYKPDYGQIPEYVYVSEFGKGRGINMELLPQIHHGLFNKDIMSRHLPLRKKYTDILLSRTLVYDIKLWPAYIDEAVYRDVSDCKRRFDWLIGARYVSPFESAAAFEGGIAPGLRAAYYTRAAKDDAFLVIANVSDAAVEQLLKPVSFGDIVPKAVTPVHTSSSFEANRVSVEGTAIRVHLGPGQYTILFVNHEG